MNVSVVFVDDDGNETEGATIEYTGGGVYHIVSETGMEYHLTRGQIRADPYLKLTEGNQK